MAETPSLKIQYEYQNPNNVESEVPGSQNIREVTEKSHVDNQDGAEIRNGGYTITRSSYTEQSETVEGTKITRTTVTLSTNSTSEELVTDENTEVIAEKSQEEDARVKTKIPKLKFRQAAERVRRERRLTRGLTPHETHIPVPSTPSKLSRHSKIPPPTSKPVVQKRDNEETEVTRPDEEFDKIYEEVVENTQTKIEVEHPEIIESKFEEIIHDYDENKNQPINVEKIRQSRIPSLRRRSTEHAEVKSLVLHEKTKSRSLPRLKEISMRVKADNEGLDHGKFSRSLSTDHNEGGQKHIVETRITKNPEVGTRISKVVTTETITSGKELNKNIESNSKSVTVHRTIRVTSKSEATADSIKNVEGSHTLQTENTMKGSIEIGYPTFKTKLTESTNETNKGTTEICENTKNINVKSKNNTFPENKTVIKHSKSSVSEATSTLESSFATKVSVTKLASSYDVITGDKEVINSKVISRESDKSIEITELSPPTIESSMTIAHVTESSSDNGQGKETQGPKTLTAENNKAIKITELSPTIERSMTITHVAASSSDNGQGKETQGPKSLTTENNKSIEITELSPTIERSVTITRVTSTSSDNGQVKEIQCPKTPTKENNKSVEITELSPTFERTVNITRVISSSSDIGEVEEVQSPKTPTRESDNSVEITELSPTAERTMTITRVTSSSNDSGQAKEIKSPKTPTEGKNNVTKITERKFVEVRSKIPTFERTSTRVISSSNDVKVKEIKDFKTVATEKLSKIETNTTKQNTLDIENNIQTGEGSQIQEEKNETTRGQEDAKLPTKENDEAIKKITAKRKTIDIQNKSPTIERSVSTTGMTEFKKGKSKEINDNKSTHDDRDKNIDRFVARKTIVTSISKQMSETKGTTEEPIVNKKDSSIEFEKVNTEASAKELTAETGKVGKLIHRIDSNEISTETTRKDKLDEMPKKKSILSKIAMFERHDVDDRMPKKRPEPLEKLVIKHSAQKVGHLHTPTIVEEVLKSHENSPLTANSNKEFSRFKTDSSSNYKLKSEIQQGSEYTEHNVISSHNDQRFTKSGSVTEFDYKIKADEYKQTVEMSKVNLIPHDEYKDYIAICDFPMDEVENFANESDQSNESKKDVSNLVTSTHYDVSSIKSELVSTAEHKFDTEVKDNQYEQDIKTNENNSLIVNNNIIYDEVMKSRQPKTFEYQFKGVNRLTSEYERRAETSKITNTTKEIKIDSSFKPMTTMDYKIDTDVSKSIYEIDQKYGTSKQVAKIRDSTKNNNISITNKPITPLDYIYDVDTKKQGIDNAQTVDLFEQQSTVSSVKNKEENQVTSEASKTGYTFNDVKKLATEYAEKVELTRILEAQSRKESVSPNSLNYESKYISQSTESLGKTIADAPVILISPKFNFPTETSSDTRDNKVEISSTQIKEVVGHKTAVSNDTQLVKQISTEYKEANINDKNINNLNTQHISSNVFERSTSLKTSEMKDLSSITLTNESNFGSTQSSKISTVNWVSKGTITNNKVTSDIRTSKTDTLETVKGNYSEAKATKAKGYVIKREGDLAYARIQEEAEYGDEIRTFDTSKFPKTLVKETSSTVTKKNKYVDEKKKYYADVDINTVFKGKVSRMISRMTSVDTQEVDKKIIDVKEMPRKMSVLEKIALYESKASAGKTDHSYVSRTRFEKPKPQIQNMTAEEFEERVAELKSARLLYGRIENMPNILLRNGVEMPVLAIGTATLDTRLLPHVIGAAIDLGYRAIDTAYVYGNEKEIGDAIRAKIEDGTVRREELFIMSKLWSTFHRSDLVEKACRSSLDAMGLDYFDLYLIHNPMSFKEGGDTIPKIATVIQYSQFDYLDAWYGMERLMTKGLARSIGVSNFNSVQLQRILDKGKIKPTVNQVECHPYLSQQKLDSFCEERDIRLSCYGVLGSKGTPAEYKSTLPPVIDDPLVQVMASGINVSPAQLLIRYQLDSGRAAVVKTSSGQRLWDNLQALTFTLTQGQVEALQALNRNKRIFTFKGMGDTHKNFPFKIPF